MAAPSASLGVANQGSQRASLTSLPVELKLEILDELMLRDVGNLSVCSRSWNAWLTPFLYQRDYESYAIIHACNRRQHKLPVKMALSIIEKSVQNSGDVNTYYNIYADCYVSPIHLAVLARDKPLVELLLKHGAQPDATCTGFRFRIPDDITEFTGLGPYYEVRRILFTRKRNETYHYLERFVNHIYWMPLILAWAMGDCEMADILVQSGASGIVAQMLPAPDEGRLTILHMILHETSSRFQKWAHFFTKFNHLFHLRVGDENETVLHIAARSGNWRALKCAIEAGAKTDSLDSQQRTPTSGAIQELCAGTWHRQAKHILKCVEILLASGAPLAHGSGPSAMELVMTHFRECPAPRPEVLSLTRLLIQHGHVDMTQDANNPMASLCRLILREAVARRELNPLLKRYFCLLWQKGAVLRGHIGREGGHANSLLYDLVMHADAQPHWFYDKLCEGGASVERDEADAVFAKWYRTPRLHSGRHAWNIWRDASIVSQQAIDGAYEFAMGRRKASLVKMLDRSSLARPTLLDVLRVSYRSPKNWPWEWVVKKVVQGGEYRELIGNMAEALTFRIHHCETFSAMAATRDCRRLKKAGMPW